ncbi:phosphonate ABC transporter, permease protein PhnE [Pseudactinotalea suaedae]|uniref:phosphonate ABC transporter, permease protein PhnE n=1 Tax=Pseudactinotalea suaedae TaxID=1524924 RepID=UPI0012E30484|nr:phosphonate ABC transporter, permease protein PhnE [Pseudactinotalea suaedae]
MTATATERLGERTPLRPPKPAPRWAMWAGVGVAAIISVYCLWAIEFTLRPLVTDLTNGQEVLRQFFDPNWAFAWRVRDQWLVTVEIAVIASLIGCAFALVLALMASRVTAPTALYRVMKLVLAVQRSLPDLAWVLLFVTVVSTGPLAGILALIMFNIGVAAKLTAESIDAVDPGPVEAAQAVGANALQRARVAVVPQVMPSFVSYSFYVFELNIRASLVIGMGGGGGIGEVIRVQLASFSYANISAVVAVLIVVVFALDQLSRTIRRRLI